MGFSAKTAGGGGGGGPSLDLSKGYISDANKFPLPNGTYPVPALQVPPQLKLKDLLKIERTLQHVVRNTVTYSRAVWMSLTPEERAILLEGYTIGVPKGGLTDPTQFIPLLNCVGNQVLGFYGNTMILPFTIPPAAVAATGPAPGTPGLTTGAVQGFLKKFHTAAFSSPVSLVALPTRGVLCEAVLGQSPSGEKIDLTRFWNWSDSPIPQATDITDIKADRPPLLTKDTITAPSTLGAIPSIIANVTGGPSTGDSGAEILKALIAKGPEAKDFTPVGPSDKLLELGGKTLDTAEKARADALSKAQDMAKSVISSLPSVINAQEAKKDKEKKEADAAAAAKEKKTKDAAKNLKDNAPNLLKAANNQKDQLASNDFAKQALATATDCQGLPVDVAATLLDAFTQMDGAQPNKGSLAFLAALGLQPPQT